MIPATITGMTEDTTTVVTTMAVIMVAAITIVATAVTTAIDGVKNRSLLDLSF